MPLKYTYGPASQSWPSSSPLSSYSSSSSSIISHLATVQDSPQLKESLRLKRLERRQRLEQFQLRQKAQHRQFQYTKQGLQMPPHVVFAFGPDHGILFEINGKRYRNNLPPELEKLYTFGERENPRSRDLKKTISLVLFSEGGYFIAYERYDGEHDFGSDYPDKLYDFLDKDHRLGRPDMSTLYVSIGAEEGTFFASAYTTSEEHVDVTRYRWHDIPEEAEQKLQNNVACNFHSGFNWRLTLGANDSYIIYSKSGPQNIWSSGGNIPGKLYADILTHCKAKSPVSWNPVIVLNPYDEEEFFRWFPAAGEFGYHVDRKHRVHFDTLIAEKVHGGDDGDEETEEIPPELHHEAAALLAQQEEYDERVAILEVEKYMLEEKLAGKTKEKGEFIKDQDVDKVEKVDENLQDLDVKMVDEGIEPPMEEKIEEPKEEGV